MLLILSNFSMCAAEASTTYSFPTLSFPLLPNCLVGSLLPRDGKPGFHNSRKLAFCSLALHSNNTIPESDLVISYRQLMPSQWGFPPVRPWSSVTHERRVCRPDYVGAACQPMRPSKGCARESAWSHVQMWCLSQASFSRPSLHWVRLDATKGNRTWATENKWLLYKAFQTSVMMTRFLWLCSTPPHLPFAILKKLLFFFFSPSTQNFPLAAALAVQ